MASPTVDVATGITITFGTSGFSAELLDLDGPSMTRDAIQTSHQGTTVAHTKTPADLYDPGELTATLHFNPDTALPIDDVAETITINWPSGWDWVFTGFATGYSPSAPFNDKMTADLTITVSGTIVPTASS